jgi:hypothetical protein
MKTEVSTDKPIADALMANLVSVIENGLSRFANRLTRVEVHLKNADGTGSGQTDCSLEVRPANRDPVIVKDQAATAELAVRGAVGKMNRLLDSTFGRLDAQKGGTSASGLPT